MRRTSRIGLIVLALALLIACTRLTAEQQAAWDERLEPPRQVRPYFNPEKNRQRWLRRRAKQQRRQPPVSRAARRRRREQVLRTLLTVDPSRAGSGGGKPRREAPQGSSCCPPWLAPASQDARLGLNRRTSRRRKRPLRPFRQPPVWHRSRQGRARRLIPWPTCARHAAGSISWMSAHCGRC